MVTGYVQSVEWTKKRQNGFDMYPCLTVEVPANHSVMLSFSNLDLLKCCSCNSVKLFFTNGCSGKPAQTLCHNTVFDPTVYDIDIVSIAYRNPYKPQGTGFKLLFSFHHTSERPVQVKIGKWDCAVPGASVWMQHFLCSPKTFCDGGEDRDIGGCPSAELCGANFITLRERCYLHVSPSGNTSWYEAEDICKAKHGHLVSLNTQQEWTTMKDWMEDTETYKHKYIPIGLRLNTFPEQDT